VVVCASAVVPLLLLHARSGPPPEPARSLLWSSAPRARERRVGWMDLLSVEVRRRRRRRRTILSAEQAAACACPAYRKLGFAFVPVIAARIVVPRSSGSVLRHGQRRASRATIRPPRLALPGQAPTVRPSGN
jgi:hypothetical protein